ncbi:MAG: D-tyrosyl-tRNA(Tyr) deacylase [Candidatus Eremiobacteraeota bacterium]|nr:D-tyrosyl-tRNA(Tyr) deacylase [Candidatus Eremiobacteraeota bacterium]
MRAVVQRVARAEVRVGDELVGRIGAGLLVFLGIGVDDDARDADALAAKVGGLRIFRDDAGNMNCDVGEIGGAVLVISQFTLHGDARKGRRPSFIAAARPEVAEPLYERVAQELRRLGIETATGRFGATMAVELVNDGPVTILLDTKRLF